MPALHLIDTLCTMLSYITGHAEQLQKSAEVSPPGAEMPPSPSFSNSHSLSPCTTSNDSRSIAQRARHVLASMQDSRRDKKLATWPQSSTGRAGLSAPPRAIMMMVTALQPTQSKQLVSTQIASMAFDPILYYTINSSQLASNIDVPTAVSVSLLFHH